MGVEDEVGRRATLAADKSRKVGIEEVPTAVLDPPQSGGVMMEPKTGKQRPKRNTGIVARRATRRSSAGKARRFVENRIRIRANRTRKSAAVTLHPRIARVDMKNSKIII